MNESISKAGDDVNLKDESGKSTQKNDVAMKTIDAYLADQPDEIRPILEQVRKKLQEALPEAQERIAWGMPTYWHEHNIIHFAAFRNHMGLYPGPQAVAHFADRLHHYKTSKGAIQFPYKEPVPLDLIAEIARWCFETGYHH